MTTSQPNPYDIAWFAGLFEGEGCIHKPRHRAARITLCTTDRDIIDRVDALFPMPNGIYCRNQHGYGSKPVYTWLLAEHARVKHILQLILPYLGERRRQRALELIEFIDNRPGQGGVNRSKTHCPQNHAYTPENTYRPPGNPTNRQCRTCIQNRNDYKSRKRKEARLAKLSG